jgi:hypothetical protein
LDDLMIGGRIDDWVIRRSVDTIAAKLIYRRVGIDLLKSHHVCEGFIQQNISFRFIRVGKKGGSAILNEYNDDS